MAFEESFLDGREEKVHNVINLKTEVVYIFKKWRNEHGSYQPYVSSLE